MFGLLAQCQKLNNLAASGRDKQTDEDGCTAQQQRQDAKWRLTAGPQGRSLNDRVPVLSCFATGGGSPLSRLSESTGCVSLLDSKGSVLGTAASWFISDARLSSAAGGAAADTPARVR